jgi:hypothetical protein
MSERCPDCPKDATHTLRWETRAQAWQIRKLYTAAEARQTIHRYCRWHAIVRVVQRNARGVLPGVAHLKKLLARQEVPDGPQED